MKELNFNIYNIIIFSGIVQGLIFSSVVLFNKKYKSTTNFFIALTVLVLTLSNLQYWFIDVKLKELFFDFFNLRVPFDMLITPMFFLFVSNYLQIEVTKKFRHLVLAFFLIGLCINILIAYSSLFDENVFEFANITLDVFSLVFNFILIGFVVLRINSYEKNNRIYEKNKVRAETKWLKRLLYIGGIMCLGWLVVIVIQIKYNAGLDAYYPLWISISLLVYWISYESVFNSKIQKEREIIRSNILPKSNEFKIYRKNKKPNSKLFISITNWIEKDKRFLSPDVSIEFVANQFNISNGYLSQLINNHGNFNFNDYINSLRVEEAKLMLKNKNFDNYTVTAIGLEAGFNSKSSFYASFKKFTKVTPS